MKYHALFVIFEIAAKFEIVVCCKLSSAANCSWGSMGYNHYVILVSAFKELFPACVSKNQTNLKKATEFVKVLFLSPMGCHDCLNSLPTSAW